MFFEWAALIVAVSVLALPSSKIVVAFKSRLSTLGLSSLKSFNVNSVSEDVTLTRVPNERTIVSIVSTSESSKPFVDMVIVPVVDPAGIVIGLEETVNSVVSVAVPPIV